MRTEANPVGQSTPFARRLDMRVIAAYAAIYIVWGSTFLALRYAVGSIPPLLTIALRSTIAGVLLFGWALLQHKGPIKWRDWRDAAVGGFFFFVLCHGSLSWAEQYISSGVAAVLMALIPAWVVVLDWLRPGGVRPAWLTIGGVVVSFVGVAFLVGPSWRTDSRSIDVVPALVLVGAAFAWAAGTIFSRNTSNHLPPTTVAAMQLLTGGAMVLLASALSGEWTRFNIAAIEPQAIAGLAYLIVAGSLLTFSAYLWLVRVSSPARVATYAYVNPVVAIMLGWLIANESLSIASVAATAVIIVGVVLIISAQHNNRAG